MTLPTSREISRRAVRDRIQQVAERLIDERGYRETTVGDIAAEVGISERTFFRYFATKDDLLFATFDSDTRWAVDSITGRPLDEDVWDTLQAIMEAALDRIDSDAQRRATLFHSIAADSPQVLASYLTHVQAFQRSIADALWARRSPDLARGSSEAAPDERIILSAIVSSAFAALNEVAARSTDRSPLEQRRLVRAALAAIRPAVATPSRR